MSTAPVPQHHVVVSERSEHVEHVGQLNVLLGKNMDVERFQVTISCPNGARWHGTIAPETVVCSYCLTCGGRLGNGTDHATCRGRA